MKKTLKIIITIIMTFILLPNIYNAFEIQQEDGTYKKVKNIPYSGYKYSYTKCNGSKVKDKDAIYNEETQSFTMNNITEISKCNFYFDRDGNEIINRYTVNVIVLNGTVDGEASKTVNQGNDVTFKLKSSTGYGPDATVKCTSSADTTLTYKTSMSSNESLTVHEVENDNTCTVTYEEKGYTIKFDPNGGSNLAKVSLTSEGATNTWTYENGAYKSGNNGVNSSTSSASTENFTLTETKTISFEWAVSSEKTYDYLYYTIYKDGTALSGTGTSTKISGNDSITSERDLEYIKVEKELEPGTYYIKFSYYKDSSASNGLDTGYVKNIMIPLTTQENETLKYNESKKLSKNTYTRDGYTFLGWNEDQTATEVTYRDEQEVSNLTTGDEITLYAVWKLNTYTANVTVLNGTVDGETSKAVNHGSNVSFTLKPSTGYGNPEVTCTNNQKGLIGKPDTPYPDGSVVPDILKINNISDNTTCTVTYYDLTESCFAFNKSTGTITDYYDYQGGGTSGTECSRDVVIPSTIQGVSVTAIGKQAFQSNQLTSVIIPDSVTTIGNSAFYYNNLTSIIIPTNVTTIGEVAFSYNQLTTVTIPNKVTTIGEYAFSNNELTSVKIGDSVTSIGICAFRENQLTTVTIPDSVETIGSWAFMHNQLTTVTIPDSVTTIGTSAFRENQLTEVTIPDSVTIIGDWAFEENQLTSVTISNKVTTIGDHAFASNNLTTVAIPDSVTTIGTSAFYANQLTTVIIPDSVTTIGTSAFSNNQLTTVTIPDRVTTIGNSAFYANQLTAVTIPDSVTAIGDLAFNGNQLTSVKIGDSVTTIGKNAFGNNRLTAVAVPHSVEIIGDYAFASNQLTTVTIPDSVTSIGNKAFLISSSYNSNLTSIINKTGRSFDWGLITSGTSGNNFITGSFTSPSGKTLTVSAS